MKSAWKFIASLSASFVLACGVGAETNIEQSAAPVPAGQAATGIESNEASTPEGQVSAQACVTLYRPRYSSYWQSFPIEVDGLVGECETFDNCTTSCWGQQNSNAIHHGFFYCTYCP